MKNIVDLNDAYLSIDGKGRVAAHPGGAEFWRTINTNASLLDSLVGIYTSTSDWPNWEMHPAGEEVLILVEGEMTIVLDEAGEESHHRLRAGEAFIVPRGAWHRALVARPSKLVGITCGAGTQHRPLS